MGPTWITLLKLVTALLAAGACYRLMRGPSRGARLLLAVCALAAVGAYFQFGRVPAGFLHRWELFHYYVGSKYHAELGYENLYRCAVVADAEQGIPAEPGRKVRALASDEIVSVAELLQHPELCTGRFSAERWRAFSADIRFFRRGLGRSWHAAQLDHGYNPPPLWTATWGRLCQVVPLSVRHLQWLAALDLLFMLGVIAALAWGFGSRTALLGVVFWGTQAASELGWTGGGLARQDWLFLCVLGLACLRRGHAAWAGAALVSAGCLRLFPLLLLLGPCIVWAARWRRLGALPPDLRRFAFGVALAAGVACGISVARCGLADQRAFWLHIQLRREAVVSNHMGLTTVLTSLPLSIEKQARDQREPDWVLERRARATRLAPLRILVMAGAVLLVICAAWQARRAWVGAALALLLIPITLDPSNYYYSFFILLVPLVDKQRSLAVLLGVMAAGGQLLSLQLPAFELRFAALSALYIGLSLIVALAFVRFPRLAPRSQKEPSCKIVV